MVGLLGFAGLTAQLLFAAPKAEATASPPAPQEGADDEAAKAAWTEGVEAYREGRFRDAIPAFEKAYRDSGRPGPLFSLGQAHRHLWDRDRDDRQRLLAMRRFEQYLIADPAGPRAIEAERFIEELKRFEELEGLGSEEDPITRLGLSSSAPGAVATLDNTATYDLPATPEVDPGKHTIVVRAPGFLPNRQVVDVPEGALMTLTFELSLVPGTVSVAGAAGSVVYVDGSRVGSLPLDGPLQLESGRHQVGVARPGRVLVARDVVLEPGEHEELTAPSLRTGQRKVAIAAMSIGGAGVLAAGILTVAALLSQRQARPLDDKLRSDSLSAGENHTRDGLIARRDGLRTAALATGAVGFGVLVTGVVLYATDRPPVESQLHAPIEDVPPFALGVGADGVSVTCRGRF